MELCRHSSEIGNMMEEEQDMLVLVLVKFTSANFYKSKLNFMTDERLLSDVGLNFKVEILHYNVETTICCNDDLELVNEHISLGKSGVYIYKNFNGRLHFLSHIDEHEMSKTIFMERCEIIKPLLTGPAIFNEYVCSEYKLKGRIEFDTSTFAEGIGKCKSREEMLILYCHSEDDIFTHYFMHCLTQSAFSNFISKRFLLQGLLISKKKYQREMQACFAEAIDDDGYEADELQKMFNGHASIFVFMPVGDRVFLVATMDEIRQGGECSMLEFEKSLLELLSSCHDNFKEMNFKPELEKWVTFQQMMCNNLGDRGFNQYKPHELNYLEQNVSYAYYGQPKNTNERNEGVYTSNEKEMIMKAYTKIREQNNEFCLKDTVNISMIFICFMSDFSTKTDGAFEFNGNDFLPYPCFIIRKCENSTNPCRIIIDHTLRVYTSWDKFLKENKFPKGVLCVPRSGYYSVDENNDVQLTYCATPACGLDVAILKVTDVTSSVTGIGAGVTLAIAAIPAVTMAPVVLPAMMIVGVASGIYGIARSAFNIYDRVDHKQTMHVSDPAARAAYFNIVAGSMAFIGMGATGLLTGLARNGVNITRGAILTVDAVNVANMVTSGVAVINSTVDMFNRPTDADESRLLEYVQLGTSVLFFGHSVYSFTSAATLTQNVQQQKLNQIKDNLRSNRHRRTFNKLYKETHRLADGNTIGTNAKVIKSLNTAQGMRDDMIATLTRNNKRLNEVGIRYSADAGGIAFNGKVIDVRHFARCADAVSVAEVFNLTRDFSTPAAQSVNLDFGGLINQRNILTVGDIFYKLCVGNFSLTSTLEAILRHFQPDVRNKLVELIWRILPKLNGSRVQSNELISHILTSIIHGVYDVCDKKYKFGEFAKKTKDFIVMIISSFLRGRSITDMLVNEVLDFAIVYICKVVDYFNSPNVQNESVCAGRSPNTVLCKTCTGFYYSR